MAETDRLKEIRLEKMKKLMEAGEPAFPNDFRVQHLISEVVLRYQNHPKEQKIEDGLIFTLAGRVMAINDFGKGGFVRIQDRSGKIQVFISKQDLGEERFLHVFKNLDIGDFIGITGPAFFTRTGELTLHTQTLRILVKSLHSLPEKWHGISDVEIRYRKRYLDLIMNPESREIFRKRTLIIQEIRKFFDQRDFLEVETPMMQVIAGGATARPFMTHHNALDLDLYLRIAPELFLKRLVVGGFERVYEINRNFRNEGISLKHNPEFTMLEFYQAYATYEDLMTLTEELLSGIAQNVCHTLTISYQNQRIDLTPPWPKIPMFQAVAEKIHLSPDRLRPMDEEARRLLKSAIEKKTGEPPKSLQLGGSDGHLLFEAFEALVEEHLISPTFIIGYPIEVSPLSRRSQSNPDMTDRFELFVGGREIANGFSELNDPVDQRQRFEAQMAERATGNEEAPPIDEDYVGALEYGMPPTAGEGIGIDRLVMLLTDTASIREAILFPLLRPE